MCDALSAENDVWGVDKLSYNVDIARMPANITLLMYDIRNESIYDELGKQEFDYCFHFASPCSILMFNESPTQCWNESIEGTKRIMEFCQYNGVKLIIPSSGSITKQSMNLYAKSKVALEGYMQSWDYPHWVVAKIFATYGSQETCKGKYASVAYQFARRIKDRQAIEIWGDGRQTRDFIYIDDVINSLIVIAQERSKEIVEVGSGSATDLIMLSELIGEKLGLRVYRHFLETPPLYLQDTLANTSELNSLGMHPYGISEGLDRMLDLMPRHAVASLPSL